MYYKVMVRFSVIPLVGFNWLATKIGPMFTMVLMLFSGIGLIGLMRIVKFKGQITWVLYPNIFKKILEKRFKINFLKKNISGVGVFTKSSLHG